ncbi:MAG: type IV pilus assembly protein PilZ [Saprospiraceae bacterium]|jgi:type IV pilus assembly protein PilZ
MSDDSQYSKSSTIPLRYKSMGQVYKSFMPFLSNGGLFIPTKKNYKLGDEVNMVVKLPDGDEKYKLTCSVVWISPEAISSDKKQGIGVEFPESNGSAMRHRIESYLGDRLASEEPTYTM